MKNIIKILLIAILLNIGSSFSAEAQNEGGITCTKQYSFPPLYLGYVEVGINVWTCTNGCLYTTTFMKVLTDNSIAILSDVENCS